MPAVPCLGTTTVPSLGMSMVPCLGTFANALPGHVCSPCLGRLPVPCLGTLASVHALPGLACACVQIHIRVCLSTGVNAGKRHVSSPGYSYRFVSRAGCRQEAAVKGGEQARPIASMRARTQLGPVVKRMQRRWALHQLTRHSGGRSGGNARRRCASLPEHVCRYLFRAACRWDAMPASAAPARPHIRAGTRPGPVSTGGSAGRGEQARSSMCAGTQLGRVVFRRQCRQVLRQFARVCMQVHIQGR